jgi:Domain of unknown function (DUF5069)
MTPLDLTKAPPRSPREKLREICMLPRMIDIARAKLRGGRVGEYQIGRGMSAVVLGHLGISAEEFVRIVEHANGDEEVADRLCSPDKQEERITVSDRLHSLTVKDVPRDLQAQFEKFYGANQPQHRRVFDIIEADDAKIFGRSK